MDNPKELIESARMSIQSLREILEDIDECLKRLHENCIAQTVVEAAGVTPSPPLMNMRTLREVATTDPRFPYLAGRQPRRDGDSYGTVPEPTDQGGTYYGKAKTGKDKQ